MPFMGRRTTQGAVPVGVDDVDDDDITREMRRVGIDVLEACLRETLPQQETAQRMADAMRAFKEREQDPTRLRKNLQALQWRLRRSLVRQPGSMRGTRPPSSFTSTRVFSP
jgi:regulator of protease activity HflC (stomatin/prohibitin superfamily)